MTAMTEPITARSTFLRATEHLWTREQVRRITVGRTT